ncbi:MAG TPA: HTTM domain-containing protein [Solimonas sp.]|nr:HTTM domain-containing protein [Solimonas sp.]
MTTDFQTRHPHLAELFGIDLRTLALFRFALGIVLFFNLGMALGSYDVFWTDAGIMPRAWMIESDSAQRISLHLANGEGWFIAGLLLAQMLFAGMMALGWHTRTATILSFVLWASLLNRNVMVLIGGDLLMACLLFWAMFLPLGARFSVDAAIAHNPPPQRSLHLSWASLGLLLQVMSVYFFSAFLKSGREWVPDYTAVYYALSLDRHVLPPGKLLNEFFPLTQGLSFYVWWLELLGPILIFSPLFLRPLRSFMQLNFMAMHVGFLLCLELGHFPYVSLASLTVFTGGWFWDWCDRRNRERHPGVLRLYYDRDCGFCWKMCRLFQQFLALPHAQIAPAQDTPRAKTLLEANNSWVVIDGEDRAHLKWQAFVALLRQSPVLGWLWPLARRPVFDGPGTRAYDFVARHRGRFAALSASLLPQREIRWEVGPRVQGLAGVLVLAVFVWNLHSINVFPANTYAMMAKVFRAIRIDQHWGMFAPFPLKDDGWMVIPARLADGTELDLMHPDAGPPDYGKPSLYSQDHGNIRWLTYRGRLWEAQYNAHRLQYGKYLCRSWNRDKLEGDARSRRLMTFKMIYMLERTPPPGEPLKVEQVVLWRHECFPDETKGQIP